LQNKVVITGLLPRPSGSDWVPLERQLSRVKRWWRLDLEQAVEAPAVHQIGPQEAGDVFDPPLAAQSAA